MAAEKFWQVHDYDWPHEFPESELEMALTVARQVAFGIERRQAEERERILVQEL